MINPSHLLIIDVVLYRAEKPIGIGFNLILIQFGKQRLLVYDFIHTDAISFALLLFFYTRLDLIVYAPPARRESLLYGPENTVLFHILHGIFCRRDPTGTVERLDVSPNRAELVVLNRIHFALHRGKKLHISELCDHLFIFPEGIERDPCRSLRID